MLNEIILSVPFEPALSGRVLFVCMTFFLLFAISMSDFRTKRIPNRFILLLFALAALSTVIFPQISVLNRFAGLFCVSLPMSLLAVWYPRAFGRGDRRLMAAAGYMLGWEGTYFAFAAGVFLGGACCVYLIVSKKRRKEDQIAFGPFLCAGIAISFFCGLFFGPVHIL